MIIDFDLLESYDIDDFVIIPEEYYKNSDIKRIDKLYVKGNLNYDVDKKIHGNLDIHGIMILVDAISLEEEEYPFSIKYDDILEESLKKDENKLDLFEFLWENIVLEIPLKFTKVQDLSKFHGDGWKLISEEELNSSNNPFNDLLKNFDKKE